MMDNTNITTSIKSSTLLTFNSTQDRENKTRKGKPLCEHYKGRRHTKETY